jgi:hypothetical protein
MSEAKEKPRLSRSDFLRLAALGAGGLGVGAFAGYAFRSAVPEGPRQGYVVAITHGPKDPDRVMLALVTASKLPKGDNHVWFSIDGGQLCKKGDADKVSSPLFTKQGNAAKMIEELRARGIAIHI